jgi:hypothetical protein
MKLNQLVGIFNTLHEELFICSMMWGKNIFPKGACPQQRISQCLFWERSEFSPFQARDEQLLEVQNHESKTSQDLGLRDCHPSA